ncbi:hypothetical protein EA772_15385 [Pedobacter sp. G11]|uniref:hypothetical protein n=1 Tax=Pedobacter sp. G11 TaxID=2482728 RepID=UPI000F5E5CD3|nr:hypothetical protein [Pedobacter sp. G11]AZI26656.1 hypothetical protein EA772_15385 [Pedobacter sp. G11]
MTIPCRLCAQARPDITQLKFETLKLSSAPAFILLGVEPENIQRPGTPTKFITGLQNSVTDSKIQPNLAFEISPYYMTQKTVQSNKIRFNAAKFMLDRPGLFETIARTATVSIGTSVISEKSFGNLQKGTGLGIGMRFQLISGNPSDAYRNFNYYYLKNQAIERIEEAVDISDGSFDISKIFDATIETFINSDLQEFKNNTLSRAEIRRLRKELKSLEYEAISRKGTKSGIPDVLRTKRTEGNGIINKSLEILNRKATPLAKQGFMLEVAAGQVYVFEDDAFSSGRHAKSGIWLVPSFRWDIDKTNPKMSLFDIMFVGRHTLNNQSAGVDQTNYLDAGSKLAFTRQKWSMNVEFVYRYATNPREGLVKNYTYRLVSGLDYKISDAVTLKFNFGTNFDGNSATYTQAKKIFAIGGINLGLVSFKPNADIK